jgi:hypothetical protein
MELKMRCEWRIWPITAVAALAAAVLAACGSSGSGTAHPAGQGGTAATARHAAFSHPAKISNRLFPLVPGTEFRYRGRIVEGGQVTPHSVVFTVTDVTKMVGGVRTVVAWDRDFREGKLQEQELALFAQDDRGNVWNFGEYPEEYENGKFTGAPSTWIKGAADAYGGIHVLAAPADGNQYVEGRVPSIDFYDLSKVVTASPHVVVDEWSPGDPKAGHQIKHYAPGTGLVRVGARGGDSQEFLTLTRVRHLGPQEMTRTRDEVVAMDGRGHRISKVYRTAGPAVCCQG